MEPMLDKLNKEYHTLVEQYISIKQRINAIGNTITAYGGTVPEIEGIEGAEIANILADLRDKIYPSTGTWNDKVKFVLGRLNRPVTAQEITAYIRESEPATFMKPHAGDLSSVMASVCSKMGKDGEIGVDNSQFKNKYFLKS